MKRHHDRRMPMAASDNEDPIEKMLYVIASVALASILFFAILMFFCGIK